MDPVHQALTAVMNAFVTLATEVKTVRKSLNVHVKMVERVLTN